VPSCESTIDSAFSSNALGAPAGRKNSTFFRPVAGLTSGRPKLAYAALSQSAKRRRVKARQASAAVVALSRAQFERLSVPVGRARSVSVRRSLARSRQARARVRSMAVPLAKVACKPGPGDRFRAVVAIAWMPGYSSQETIAIASLGFEFGIAAFQVIADLVPLYPLLVEYLAHRALHQLGEAGVETMLFAEERIKYAADQRATTKDSGAATKGNRCNAALGGQERPGTMVWPGGLLPFLFSRARCPLLE
jgi:hypothetical protein